MTRIMHRKRGRERDLKGREPIIRVIINGEYNDHPNRSVLDRFSSWELPYLLEEIGESGHVPAKFRHWEHRCLWSTIHTEDLEESTDRRGRDTYFWFFYGSFDLSWSFYILIFLWITRSWTWTNSYFSQVEKKGKGQVWFCLFSKLPFEDQVRYHWRYRRKWAPRFLSALEDAGNKPPQWTSSISHERFCFDDCPSREKTETNIRKDNKPNIKDKNDCIFLPETIPEGKFDPSCSKLSRRDFLIHFPPMNCRLAEEISVWRVTILMVSDLSRL